MTTRHTDHRSHRDGVAASGRSFSPGIDIVAVPFTEAATDQTPTAGFVNGAGDTQRSNPATTRRRKLFADYLDEARAARAPGVVVTSGWVREIAGCSRGLSSRLAAALNAETAPNDAGGQVRP